MDPSSITILAAIFAVAAMYSSVGHGGASGYLAVMALLAVVPEVIRPTALVLNLFVAGIGTYQFWRAGYFSWRTFWPFAVASIPFAFVGGMIHLPTHVYKIVLGLVLMIAAVRLAFRLASDAIIAAPNIWIALAVGAGIGLLSGLVGVGGGIFLTPVLLLMNWSDTKTSAGVSALFIFVNSLAGLLGKNYAQVITLPPEAVMWVVAAIIGGLLGSTLGAKRFDSITLRRVLAGVLLFAGIKLIFV
jgi:uncharacterized protein